MEKKTTGPIHITKRVRKEEVVENHTCNIGKHFYIVALLTPRGEEKWYSGHLLLLFSSFRLGIEVRVLLLPCLLASGCVLHKPWVSKLQKNKGSVNRDALLGFQCDTSASVFVVLKRQNTVVGSYT